MKANRAVVLIRGDQQKNDCDQRKVAQCRCQIRGHCRRSCRRRRSHRCGCCHFCPAPGAELSCYFSTTIGTESHSHLLMKLAWTLTFCKCPFIKTFRVCTGFSSFSILKPAHRCATASGSGVPGRLLITDKGVISVDRIPIGFAPS